MNSEYLPQMRLACETMPLSVADALQLGREHVRDANARILAEMPERILWQTWRADENLLPQLANCLKLYIFDSAAEVRLQRAYGAAAGVGRLTRLDDHAEPTYTRFSGYCLAGSARRLKYAEHFAFDAENGALMLRFARYCGLE